jgi:hypothetical protein
MASSEQEKENCQDDFASTLTPKSDSRRDVIAIFRALRVDIGQL